MDKVVAKVPFSKGTVYKHFIGKEDLFLAMNNLAVVILADFFSRAKKFDGSARERMLLLNFSYLLYAILHPVLFKAMLCSKTSNVYGKSSEKRLNEQKQNEHKLLAPIHAIIDGAIASQQLTLPDYMNIQQFCFANWSQCYGTISLLSEEIEECSGRTNLVLEQELINQFNLMFDGLQWSPLTKEKDYVLALKNALQQVFPKELCLIKEKGRELNF
jgi:AcrR family transcriptional regulator